MILRRKKNDEIMKNDDDTGFRFVLRWPSYMKEMGCQGETKQMNEEHKQEESIWYKKYERAKMNDEITTENGDSMNA